MQYHLSSLAAVLALLGSLPVLSALPLDGGTGTASATIVTSYDGPKCDAEAHRNAPEFTVDDLKCHTMTNPGKSIHVTSYMNFGKLMLYGDANCQQKVKEVGGGQMHDEGYYGSPEDSCVSLTTGQTVYSVKYTTKH